MKPQCQVTQPFEGNATSAYKNSGLKGHSGIDSSCGFGSDIFSYWDKEYVYKVLTKEFPANDGSGFTGVFTLVEKDGVIFEFLYGHCNPEPGLLGKTITKGTKIGTEANNGEVYSGGVRITLEMQKNGDTRGSHRHDQARLLRKDANLQPNTRYITSLGGDAFYKDGFFYAIPTFDNGYNGCFDWTIPLTKKPKYEFQSVLNYGARGRSVNMLQEILKYEGYFPKDMQTTAFFGDVTAEALRKWQIANGINDFMAETNLRNVRVGLKTMRLLNEKYA